MPLQEDQLPALREALIDQVTQHLSGTYHCLRVWEAWNVGTMSSADFQDVGESDTPAELVEDVFIPALTAQREAIAAALASNAAEIERLTRERDEFARSLSIKTQALAELALKAGEKAKHWRDLTITLNAVQLSEALEFAAPDFHTDEDQRETEVCIVWAPDNTVPHEEGGFEPAGYVVWLTEYPEEGCMPLDGCNPRPLSAINADAARRRGAASPSPEGEKAEPVAWAVWWGDGCVRRHSVHFEKDTADEVASTIKSFPTEVRPLVSPSPEGADALDAARYRWLRIDQAISAIPRVWQSDDAAEPTYVLHLGDLDSAIDAAMKGKQA